MDPFEEIKKQLQEALNESTRLREENTRLKKLLGLPFEEIEETWPPPKNTFAEPHILIPPQQTPLSTNNSSP